MVENYRPISLLNNVSEVMERLVFNHVYPVIESCISHAQHRFMHKRSTTSNLLDMCGEVGATLDQGGQTDVIFLDFSKAFDSVLHNLLIHKPRSFGFNGNLLNWIQNYLSDRHQSVIINGKESDSLPVTSGVPQGSILDPLFFVLYINDLPNVCSSKVSLYADDARVFRKIKSINDCILLQKDLDSLLAWSHKWKMKFNPAKCNVISISRKSHVPNFQYCLDNNFLQHTDKIVDLGVIIDSKLSTRDHVVKTASKAHTVLGMIKRAVGYDSPDSVKRQLYLSHVRSVLEYCSPVWSPYLVTEIASLEKVQRRATKYILNDFSDISYSYKIITTTPFFSWRNTRSLFII